MIPGRRGFLKLLGVAPVGARVALAETTSKLAGLGAGAIAPGSVYTQMGGLVGGLGGAQKPMTFTSFKDWLSVGGDQMRAEAQWVGCLDPDLASMHSLPVATRVRLQRQRQYQRALEDRRRWFQKKMNFFGLVEWWP